MPFDFDAVTAPFRMQPGLRRLGAGAHHLTPNRLGDRAFREKLAVLFQHAPQALLASPGFDAEPALHALITRAAEEHPDSLRCDGDGAANVYALRLGWAVCGSEVRRIETCRSDDARLADAVRGAGGNGAAGAVRGDAPAGGVAGVGGEPPEDGAAEIGRCLLALPAAWRRAGLLSLAFAEDFAVLDAGSGCIPWLAVCLPSHWAPETKVGRHFAEVHAPVADNRLLVSAADHLARLVTGPDRWERFVWTITREPRLHAHPQRCDPAPWPANQSAAEIARRAFFRTERQTFLPLPERRQAVFTIHVEVQPLTAAVASAERAKRLHAALATMSGAVLDYRGLSPVRERLLEWLAGQAAAAPA